METWNTLRPAHASFNTTGCWRPLPVIVSGKADVRLDGARVAELGDGQFVDQIAYIIGEEGSRQHRSQSVDAHHHVVTRQARDVFQRQA
jgi:hypothetical protein